MNTKLIVERDADLFLLSYESSQTNPALHNNSDFSYKVKREVEKHSSDELKVIFLSRILTKVDQELSDHNESCTAIDKEKCSVSIYYNGLKYYTQQVIDNLSSSEQSSFSSKEKIDLNSKIDEVLEKLNELQLGQEVIYNEVDELRSLTNLNKKTFKEVVLGKIGSLVLSKATDTETLKWIYNKITGDNITSLLN